MEARSPARTRNQLLSPETPRVASCKIKPSRIARHTIVLPRVYVHLHPFAVSASYMYTETRSPYFGRVALPIGCCSYGLFRSRVRPIRRERVVRFDLSELSILSVLPATRGFPQRAIYQR